MRESASSPIEELRRHLVELGCPAKAMRRIVRETAEHLEDLRQVALKQGLSPADAVKQAEQQLGEPRRLAEQHVQMIRNSSWAGRHPLLCFVILPFMYPYLYIAALTFIGIILGVPKATHPSVFGASFFQLSSPEYRFALAVGLLPNFLIEDPLAAFFLSLSIPAFLILAALIFAGVAQCSGRGMTWMLIACAVFAIEAAVLTFGPSPIPTLLIASLSVGSLFRIRPTVTAMSFKSVLAACAIISFTIPELFYHFPALFYHSFPYGSLLFLTVLPWLVAALIYVFRQRRIAAVLKWFLMAFATILLEIILLVGYLHLALLFVLLAAGMLYVRQQQAIGSRHGLIHP